jgi:hypothetical protein
LHSSNYTNIVNNTGKDNFYDIKEVNCLNNYFEGNSFKRYIPIRDEDNDPNDSSNDLFIVDFTLILFFCLVVFILGVSINTFRQRDLSINK